MPKTIGKAAIWLGGCIVTSMWAPAAPAFASVLFPGDYFVQAFAAGGANGGESSVDGNHNWTIDGPTSISAQVSGDGAGGFGPPQPYSATAFADLASGEIKVGAASSGNCSEGVCNYSSAAAWASFGDRLTFSIPGAANETLTPIELLFESDGILADYRSGTHAFTALVDAGNAPAYAVGQYQNGVLQSGDDGWASIAYEVLEPDHFRFRATYNLPGAAPTLALRMRLDLGATEGERFDFLNTAGIRLLLPQDVTFTSASGVFLSQVQAGPVPEPATWALMIAGFGMVGGAMRRRQRRLPIRRAS